MKSDACSSFGSMHARAVNSTHKVLDTDTYSCNIVLCSIPRSICECIDHEGCTLQLCAYL